MVGPDWFWVGAAVKQHKEKPTPLSFFPRNTGQKKKINLELEAEYWLKPTLNYEQMPCLPVFNSFIFKGHSSRKVLPKRYPALSSIFTPNTELWGSWTLANMRSQKDLFLYQLQRGRKWGWAKDVRYQMVRAITVNGWNYPPKQVRLEGFLGKYWTSQAEYFSACQHKRIKVSSGEKLKIWTHTVKENRINKIHSLLKLESK